MTSFIDPLAWETKRGELGYQRPPEMLQRAVQRRVLSLKEVAECAHPGTKKVRKL